MRASCSSDVQSFIRLMLFVFFFTVGAAALAGAILADDLIQYYKSRQFLEATRGSVEKLRSLNSQYDTIVKNVESDPDILRRLAPAVIGTEPADANAVYPRPGAEQLRAAKQVLEKSIDKRTTVSVMPKWLERIAEPRRRVLLFLAGAALILTSFACFGLVRPKRE